MKLLKSLPLSTHHFEKELNWLERLCIPRGNREVGLNQRMFNEDLANIFPGSRSSGREFIVDTNDSDLADRLLSNVATRRRRYSSDSFKGLVEDITQALTSRGRALYFIRDSSAGEGFDLISLSFENVIRLGGRYIQYVPRRNLRGQCSAEGTLPRELRILDESRIILIRWPAAIRRKLSAQNRILRALDAYDGGFALAFNSQATHENPNPSNKFDFAKWRVAHDLAFYRATRQTGWNGRKHDSEKRSDFFDCHRLLRFRRLQTELRDSILTQLSEGLGRAGRKYNSEFTIVIGAGDRLISIDDINKIEKKLYDEDLSFNEVIEFCYNR